ncbi:MAG: PilZ domain-containing protein [Planctomycetota bacterium]
MRRLTVLCEKRRFKRLAMKLDLSCRKVGSPQEAFHSGWTLNVSAGGMYFESKYHPFKVGDVLRVELSVPATAGLLECGGRIFGLAKVVRTRKPGGKEDVAGGAYGAAVEFCEPPKLYS